MHHRNLLLTLFLIFELCSQSFSQKIDLDKRIVSIENVLLPEQNILEKFSTYNVVCPILPADRDKLGLTEAFAKKQFTLDGFSYLPSNPDFTIKVDIEKLNLGKEDIITKTSEYKNQSGQTVTSTKYVAQLFYIVPTSIKLINNRSGEQITEVSFATTKSPIETLSQEFPTREAAQEYLNSTKKQDFNSSFNRKYLEIFSKNMEDIKSTYAYRKTTFSEIFWEMDVKKAPEFVEFNKHLDKTIQVLQSLKSSDKLENAKNELVPTFAYWADNASKISADEKKIKKLKYGHLINLAKAQYWLEMLEECEKTSQMIVENGYDESDGFKLLEMCKSQKKEFEKFQEKTRHLARLEASNTLSFSLNDAVQESVANEIKKKDETPPAVFLVFPGNVTHITKGNLGGQLWSQRDLEDSHCFSDTYKPLFVYKENGVLKKLD